MKKFRLLLMMLLAAAVSFTACDNGGTTDTPPTDPNDPTVVLTLDEEELYADAFMAWVTTTNTERAAWLVTAHGDTTVTAAAVLENGEAIADYDLNGAEPAMVIVEDLEPATEYDLYVAVEGNGKQVLSAPLCVTTAEGQNVIEFNPTAVEPTNLSMAGVPAHMLTFVNEDYTETMTIIIVDRSVDVANYSYLASGQYPAINCENDPNSLGMPIFPTTSGVVCNPGFGVFGVWDEATDSGKEYFFVPSESADSFSGVDIITLMPSQDLSQITFNLEAVDTEGNKVVIQGSYTGALGYEVGGASKQTYDFYLDDWGFTNFTRTDLAGGYVQLKSSNINGDFVLNLNPKGGEIATEEGVTYAVEDGTLAGYFKEFVEGETTYSFISGQILLFYIDGEYILMNSPRNPLTMEGPSYNNRLATDEAHLQYVITITGEGGGSDTPAAAYTYNLVTEAPADWTGTYVVGGKVVDGTLTYLGSKNPSTYATTYFLTSTIAVENNTIASDEAVSAIEVAKVEGTDYYSIKYGEEYIGWTKDNYAAFQTAVPTSADGGFLWTPSYTSENLVKFTLSIKDGTNARWFQYNNNNARFSVYKDTSNQADVMLYALAK